MVAIVFYVLGGVALALWGVFIIHTGTIETSQWNIFIDMRGHHWSIKWAVGGLDILLGSWMVFYFLSKRIREHYKREGKNQNTVICPKCDQPFNRYEQKDMVCPVCGGPLEVLAGYYKRHPELEHGRQELDLNSAEFSNALDHAVVDTDRLINFTFDILLIPFAVYALGNFEYTASETEVVMVLIFLNSYVCEALFGFSLGKLITNTRMVDRNWKKPSLIQLTLRFLIRLIPFEFLSGYFVAGPHRPWRDRWTQTCVVDRKLLKKVRATREDVE